MPCQLIYTLNALTLLQAHDRPAYAGVLARADLSVADGVGSAWALRRCTGRVVERITGLDLIETLCGVCEREGQSVFLLGARPGVAPRAAAALIARFPGLRLAGTRSGFWTAAEEPALVEALNASGAALLLVALGQPRQEEFLDQHRAELQARVGVGVGGCFDVLAGDVRRAPGWMQRGGLEWLFRLLQEPWRIARVLRLPRFVLWILLTKHR